MLYMDKTHIMKDSLISKKLFDDNAKSIHHRHRSQTVDDINMLNIKYSNKLIFNNSICVWDAIEKLGMVSDPTDKELYSVSQWAHTLQVVNGMENDGIDDEELFLAAWLHDLGKILLLTDEDPANIVCDNFVISGEHGIGLNNCNLNWNHDEWAYMKLKKYVPDNIAWIIRYHSINESCYKYFDMNDDTYAHKYFNLFKKYDKGTKSMYSIPKVDIDKHRRMIENWIPGLIEL